MHRKLSKNDLLTSVKSGVISADQAERLWDNLSTRTVQTSKILQFVYYFGALLVISSMTWFMTLGWSWFGGGEIFLIALCYGIAFFASGYLLWNKTAFRIPGGLLTTAAVCMTPLAIFGLEKYTGIWPSGDPGNYPGYYIWIKESWLFMEVGTISVGLIALRFIRFPFLTAPVAASFWFLSMDIMPLFFRKLQFTWQQECWVSIFFGLTLLVSCYFVDKRLKKDFGFWGYLFGTLAFWGGLSLLAYGTTELNWLLYCFTNMAMMLSAIFLGRNVLMIFGALGVFQYLAHLAYECFGDSIPFPFVVSFLGILIIFLGILYQKNSLLIQTSMTTLMRKRLNKISSQRLDR